MRGWETGTLEVNSVSVEVDSANKELFEASAAKLRVVTSESSEVLAKKEAEVSGNTVKWDMDKLRLPVYERYGSSIVFEMGQANKAMALVPGIAAKPDAIAVLWLQDLTDDTEQEVKIPLLVGKDLDNLRQNAINDQTAKFHDFKVVGMLTARLKLDSGLDEDHEVGPLSCSAWSVTNTLRI